MMTFGAFGDLWRHLSQMIPDDPWWDFNGIGGGFCGMLCSKDGILQDLVGLDGILPRFLWDFLGFWRIWWDLCRIFWDFSKILWDFLGFYQDSLGFFGIVMGFFLRFRWIFGDFEGSHGIYGGFFGISLRFFGILWDRDGIFADFEGYDEIYGGFSGISTRFFWDSFEFRQDSLKVLRDFMGSRQDPFWILSPQPQKFQ